MPAKIVFNLTIVRNSDGTLDYQFVGDPRDHCVDLGLSHFIEEQLPDMPEQFRRDFAEPDVNPGEDLMH